MFSTYKIISNIISLNEQGKLPGNLHHGKPIRMSRKDQDKITHLEEEAHNLRIVKPFVL